MPANRPGLRQAILTLEKNDGQIGVLKELWDFVRHNKKFWMIPVIVILVLLGLLSLPLGTAAPSPRSFIPLFDPAGRVRPGSGGTEKDQAAVDD
ncbi:MAG: DUF5989 family protein [Ignavibacteriales bacterium]|nr:DUF5989 family protein [Ignavibacteriales bacterium]